MKKILLTIIALAMVAVGCGTPKAEVPKARESDGALLQATFMFTTVGLSLDDLNRSSLLFLSDSFDIDTVGKETTFNDFDIGLYTFPNNPTVAAFLLKYTSAIEKGITYKKSWDMIADNMNEIVQQKRAVFGNELSEDQKLFARYCTLETLKKIMDGKNFDRIAKANQGINFEDVSNNKGRVSRFYRGLLVTFLSFDKVFKAKIDVMIDEAKTKGDGVYYQKMYDMITEYLDDLRDVVKEGPYRDFVK